MPINNKHTDFEIHVKKKMKIFKKIFTAEKEKSMGLSDKDLWRVYGTPLAFRIVAGRYCLNFRDIEKQGVAM